MEFTQEQLRKADSAILECLLKQYQNGKEDIDKQIQAIIDELSERN